MVAVSTFFFFFLARGKKRGQTVMIKGHRPRSKVDHSDLIVVGFGPFEGSI